MKRKNVRGRPFGVCVAKAGARMVNDDAGDEVWRVAHVVLPAPLGPPITIMRGRRATVAFAVRTAS